MATIAPVPASEAEAPSRASEAGDRHLPCHDPARLGELLRRLEPRLFAVALRFTRDPETARDVVQNAFEKVVRHRNSFRGNAKVSTWAHRIVANEALMWLRAERRRAARAVEVGDWEGFDVADPDPSAVDQIADRQTRERVRRGVTRLRPQDRDVLLRCVLADLSYAKFGAENGVHPAAVKTRAFRARQQLGAILQNERPRAAPARGAPPRPRASRL